VLWSRSPSTNITRLSTISFMVDVIPNTPPEITVPADQTAEATSASGAVVSFTASAIDAEDAPPPTPTCAPVSGSTFPLGTTTVNCSVTDSGGLSDTGSFHVTVRDTTAPTLVGMPADMTLTTNNPAGATLTYTKPTATDTVDPSPGVVCAPASGSTIPVGTTTVTCTATDASGNPRSASFHVTVNLNSTVTWTARWGEPLGSADNTINVNGNRSIPIKVEIFANGVEQTSGNAVVSVVGCDGGTPVQIVLDRDNGRWTGKLETSQLGPGCYRVTVALDGNVAGMVNVSLRGGATATPKSSTKVEKPRP
ncbi:MAG TPA: HYR domain-containing protein, partial [Candidatus Limnocylindrales bacterium]|nr:HYR domain-containing protein [Candidatus Limnocylindrales bacterium]